MTEFIITCDSELKPDGSYDVKRFRELIRCKDCKHRGEWKRGDFSYVEFPEGSKCPGQCEDFFYSWRPDDDWFCADGEQKTGLA